MSASADPTGVFISYRREQAAPQAGRLYDWLVTRFGEPNVFMDIDSIRFGEDFVEALETRVASCDVALVLIGEGWAEAATAEGDRRLDDPDDFVRVEIETALRRAIPVVPVLLNGARLPKRDDLPTGLRPLVRRQSCAVFDATFRTDVGRLVEQLDEMLSRGPVAVEQSATMPKSVDRVDASAATAGGWVATAITRTERLCVLDVRLGDARHLITYRLKMFTPDTVELDGQLVARRYLQSRFELALSDGKAKVPAELQVRRGRDETIAVVKLVVGGHQVYEDSGA